MSEPLLPPSQSNDLPRIRERSQLEYLLGNPPTWMMRYGITAMAGILILLLLLAWLIRYPDIVETKTILTTSPPPIRVLAFTGGRISELLVSDKTLVSRDQILAVFENPAHWQDVLRLESWLAGQTELPSGELPDSLRLGALQAEYSNFSQHWKDLQFFLTHQGTAERIGYLREQIHHLLAIQKNMTAQQAIQAEELALTKRDYQRQKSLWQSQIISELEFEKVESAYLQQQRAFEAANAATLQNRMQIKQMESQIGELSLRRDEDGQIKTLSLAEDIHRLRSAITAWKQNYLVTAPIEGRVSFAKIWSAQQPITAGEEVVAIVPEPTMGTGRSKIVGKATLPAAKAGKVEEGQRAIIRLDGYPPQEFGTLEAEVRNIALLPQDEDYSFDLVIRADSLLTSFGKTLTLRQEMPGQARIVTHERRVLERIFDRLSELLKNPAN